MPKDATKNVDRYKVRGGTLNEYEFAENQEQFSEQKRKGDGQLIPGTPPEKKAAALKKPVNKAAKKAVTKTTNKAATKKAASAKAPTKKATTAKAATKKAAVATRGASAKKLAARKAAKKK